MKKIIITILIYTVTICYCRITAQVTPCIGKNGQITWEAFRGLYEGNIPNLLSWHDYPVHPLVKKTLYTTKSPLNYENYFGGRIRGYIHVPQSDSVQFNITGNEQAQFYLSNNNQESNKQLLCSLNSNTDPEQFTKFPSQTSIKIFLQQGVDYYFEIIYTDVNGSDFANLWWKTSLVDVNNWKPISFNFLKDVGCLPLECPKAGTPCNDNNSATMNDMEDGYCHCYGKQTNNNCIGARGVIENFKYDNINGSTLNDLYNNAIFPAMPTFTEVLPVLSKPNTTNIFNFGRSIQAYLKVPVSGNYKFNITGDDYTTFYLSSNDSPANKKTDSVSVIGFTTTLEHNKYPLQTSRAIYLNANQFYYIELNSKQGTGNAHFSLFWQTPFTGANQWKRIPATFIYKNECSLACMPLNSPCDDGNIYTNNDTYNSSCDCVGIPCSGADCNSPEANYVPFEKCNVTTNLDDRNDISWLSCTKTNNPNSLRPASHWIKYDLGEKHRMLTSQIWNYNVPGNTNLGFQNVAIDYSVDGITWQTYGNYTWPQSPGTNAYGGFTGPDFQGTTARYILITSLDGGGDCQGIGKAAFKAVFCPDAGTTCDDHDINTTDDKFDSACNCKGVPLYENLCGDVFKILGDSTLFASNYSAHEYVSSISKISQNRSTSFIAGNYIELKPGFSTQANAVFIAAIDTCESNGNTAARLAQKIYDSRIKKQNEPPTELLSITKNDDSDIITVQYFIDQPGSVTLEIFDYSMKPLYELYNNNIYDRGYNYKKFRTKKLNPGLHHIVLNINGRTFNKNLMVE
jgi:hypothetical protein